MVRRSPLLSSASAEGTPEDTLLGPDGGLAIPSSALPAELAVPGLLATCTSQITSSLRSDAGSCSRSVCQVAMAASATHKQDAWLRSGRAHQNPSSQQDWGAGQAPSMPACKGPHLLCSAGLEAVEPVGVVQVPHITPNLYQLLYNTAQTVSRGPNLPQCSTWVRQHSSSCFWLAR